MVQYGCYSSNGEEVYVNMKNTIVRFVVSIWFIFNYSECSKQDKNHLEVNKIESIGFDSTLVEEEFNLTDTSELNLKADLLYAKDQFAEALKLYVKLSNADSLNGKYNYRKGYCLRGLRKYNESIACYLKSIRLNYRKFDSYNNLGIIYSIGLNDNEQAKKYFEKSLEIDPNSEEVKTFIKALEGNKGESI
jgi:tetratricopeptide (TPR) repeat protein